MFIFSLLINQPPADADIDTELIRRVRSGDDNAYAEIIDRHGKTVYNAVCRVLSSAGRATDSAEEITEDALVKAWRNLSAFRGDCSLSTWLFRIAVNTAKDALRSEKRHYALSLSVPFDNDGGDGDDIHEWDVPVTSGDTVPEDALERKDTILAVRRAIESLPDDMRTVIVMRDLNEMTYTDIADALGVELGTVKSRLSRARAALKKILEDGNFAP